MSPASALLMVLAAPPAGWDALRSVKPTTAIKVHLRTGEIHKGRIAESTAERLVLRGKDGRDTAIPRDSVRRVTPKSRAWAALWGGVIGFGAGAPVGAYAGPYIADWGNPPVATRLRHAAGWGLFFGGIGAGIGALMGMERTVYRTR